MPRMSLEHFMDLVKQDIGLELRVCMPAHVIEYIPPIQGARPTPPRVRVRIDLKYAREARKGDLSPGETFVPATDPKRPGEAVGEYAEGSLLVPVHFPGPWGMWSCGPLMKGEQGKLVWCDRSIDGWQVDGGPNPIDPVFGHTHGGMNGGPLNDAWFEPGVRSGRGLGYDPASNIPTDQFRIGLGNGEAGMWINADNHVSPLGMQVSTTGGVLTLNAGKNILGGANAVSYAAKADLVEAKFNAIKLAIGALGVVGDPVTTATAVNAIITFFNTGFTAGPVGANKFKVE